VPNSVTLNNSPHPRRHSTSRYTIHHVEHGVKEQRQKQQDPCSARCSEPISSIFQRHNSTRTSRERRQLIHIRLEELRHLPPILPLLRIEMRTKPNCPPPLLKIRSPRGQDCPSEWKKAAIERGKAREALQVKVAEASEAELAAHRRVLEAGQDLLAARHAERRALE
jgi:hypothetical protein